ncbi:MAG TPA: hypothetical protein VKC53_02705 [Patescibacteria group bacterium]|nr:hypothetical protein [Patescibacteria group bacterium]
MPAEQNPNSEKFSARKVRAGAIAYYYQGFIESAQENGIELNDQHKIVKGVKRFLDEYKTLMGGVMPTMDQLLEFKEQTMAVAELQKKESHLSQRDFIRANKDKFDIDLLGSAANTRLIRSYQDFENKGGFLMNLLPIYLGKLTYGIGGDIDRDPDENAWASAFLMDKATDRIINDLAFEFSGYNTVLELGAGSGNFSKKFLNKHEDGYAVVTDKNPETQKTVRENLKSSESFEGIDFDVSELDMKDTEGLKRIAEKLGNQKIILHIGYILHENWELALETLNSLSEVFKEKNVIFAFSEYYLQDEITDEVPLDFQGLHYPTQDLLSRDELMVIANHYGFVRCRDRKGNDMETVHNYTTRINPDGSESREIMNSTTYWTLSSPV